MAGGKSLSGRMGDVSVGGILVLSQDTLEPKSNVQVRFELPGGRCVEVQGEVVHSIPGVRMGIKFLALNPELQKAIAEYAEQIKPYKRRSARLPRRFVISLRWQDWEGNWHEEPAETILVTQHGGMATTHARLKAGEDTIVSWPQTGRQAEARVVFRQLCGEHNLSELGFEFHCTQDFWGIEFPAENRLWEILAG